MLYRLNRLSRLNRLHPNWARRLVARALMLQLWCAGGCETRHTGGCKQWEYVGISWSKVPDPHGHTAQVKSAKAWGVDYRRLGCSMVGSPSVQVLSSLLLVYQPSVIKYHGFTMEHAHDLYTCVTDNNVHQISFGIVIIL